MRRLTPLAVALMILLTQSGSQADENILKTAASNGSFNTLTSLVITAGLEDALSGSGHFTVFAPTDEAFAALPAKTLAQLRLPENRDQLADILKYHVLNQRVSIPKNPPSHPLKSARTLQGTKVDFRRNGTRVRVNDAEIVTRNIACTNGVIHVIDAVLMPKPDNSLLSVARQAGMFSTLLAAAEAAGLTPALTGDDPLTVFAPTDEAFAALPKGTLKKLLQPENRDQLVDILKYHFVSGAVSSRATVQAETAETLQGATISFAIRDGRLFVNESKVLTNDVQADNGVIHVIDRVLLPQSSEHHSTSNNSEPKHLTIRASWDQHVNRENVHADSITVICSSGNIRLTNVKAKTIKTRVSGGGSVTIDGEIHDHQLQVNGGAVLNASQLRTKTATAKVNGGGTASLNVTDSLQLTASSGAEIRYVDTGVKIDGQINKYAQLVPIKPTQSTH